MSLYNKENPDYLDISLNSVFSQTIIPDQVVLVLDGPINDGLMAIVKKYQSRFPSLDVYPQEVNRGLSTALNIGLEKCRNDIVPALFLFRFFTYNHLYYEMISEFFTWMR